MKLLLVFLGVCVAVSMGEMCRDDGDCDHEMCVGDGWAVNCHFGTCTCDHNDQTGGRCVAQDDCTGNCPHNHKQHCVDGHCRCIGN